MPYYTVTAYRWGWTNAQFRQLAVTADEDRAYALAEQEHECSGGKFGIEVLEWHAEDDFTRCAYFSSAYGEEAPFSNPRISMFERIGSATHSLVTTRTQWGPPAEGVSGHVPQALEPPTWLEELVVKEEQFRLLMSALEEDAIAHRASGLPPLTEAERTARVAVLIETATREAQAIVQTGPAKHAAAVETYRKRQDAAELKAAPPVQPPEQPPGAADPPAGAR